MRSAPPAQYLMGTQIEQLTAVRATDAAARAIAALCAEGGPVSFVEELHGGELLCLGRDDLNPGRHDTLLGEVSGCLIFVDRRARRPRTEAGLLLDAREDVDGPAFVLRPRVCGRPSSVGKEW